MLRAMLRATLTAELDIAPEEMDAVAEDMYSVSPGCRRVQLATATIRSAIAYLGNTSAVVGPELESLHKLWEKMHILDMVIHRVEEWFRGDTTPPELGSPKDDIFGHINICLHIVSSIASALREYGQMSKREIGQQNLAIQSLRLHNSIALMLEIMPDSDPLLKVEDCHEGMKLSSDPASSVQPSQAEEGLEDEKLSESPAQISKSDQSPPTNSFQAEEGPEDVHPSSPSQSEAHDDTWTLRMV
ncbi:hypothetical protein N0V84_004110 [Fusarium piperis]|uniref:Uncharacterized protein n=1 Tax=Fusarium piperis TaxID=1435070 RepID=A0A9W8WG68_9HYPO|nr:hypothetical protein N0V84_004110 [Fusarium piperis]